MFSLQKSKPKQQIDTLVQLVYMKQVVIYLVRVYTKKKIIQQTCKSDTHIKLSIYSTQYTVKRPKKSELCRDRDSGLCRALYNVQCACRIS